MSSLLSPIFADLLIRDLEERILENILFLCLSTLDTQILLLLQFISFLINNFLLPTFFIQGYNLPLKLVVKK